MFKRLISLSVILMLVFGTASAAVLTNVPGSPSKSEGVALSAKWAEVDGSFYEENFGLQILPADKLTLDEIADAFEFVYEGKNPAINWYPEEVREEILSITQADPDSLYIAEFMSVHAEDMEAKTDLDVMVDFGDTCPAGQKVAVVGTIGAEDVEWTVLKMTDAEPGVCEFTVSKELLESTAGKNQLFTVVAVKGDSEWDEVAWVTEEYTVGDSVSSSTETRIVKTVLHGEETMPTYFNLKLVEEDDNITAELGKIREHVAKEPVLTWLPQEDSDEAGLLWGEDADKLIVYDYAALTALDYRPGTGDGVGTIHFPTKYEDGQRILTALGLPKLEPANEGETGMDWVIMPATVDENGDVAVAFNRWALSNMNTEAALLLVLSPAAN